MAGVMKCCMTEEQREARLINERIDKELRKYKHDFRKEFKLLLLGTGESGKSTFIKQMRIINGRGYSAEDRRDHVPLIYRNIFMGIQNLVKGMRLLGIPFATKENEEDAERLFAVDSLRATTLSAEEAAAVGRLWASSGVQAAYARRNEFQLSDSAGYFLSWLERIASVGFLPTQEDILRARAPTTGIVEYTFDIRRTRKEDAVRLRMVDVGGQRSERRKWLHSFENVMSIIFLVALSEYDQRLLEADQVNRLEESRALYKTIISYEWFDMSSVILFFNKTDLLEEKITRSDLAEYFPEFEGPARDADAAQVFIQDMFLRTSMDRKNVYSFFTCATDTENIRKVFHVVKDTIIERNLEDYGLV